MYSSLIAASTAINLQPYYYPYPAIRSIGRDTKFAVYFSFIHSFCTVMDFSAGALPIGVKFCMAVQPHFRQILSYFGG